MEFCFTGILSFCIVKISSMIMFVRKDDTMRYGALEAGGTKMVMSIMDERGKPEISETVPTLAPAETMPRMISFFRERGADVLGIGSFGPLDLNPASPSFGSIKNTPKLAWRSFPLLQAFRDELHIPVSIDTDVNAAALAEYTFGAAKGKTSCMYVTVGTGIGGGLIVNGTLVHGFMHPEIGHVPLVPSADDPSPGGFCPYHRHCMEGLASGPSIEKRWGISAKELPPDHPAWKLETDYLAQLCAVAMFSFSPEVIILGGGVMQQKFLFPEVRRKTVGMLGGYFPEPLISDGLESYIVEPGLGTASGITGAWLLAKQACA